MSRRSNSTERLNKRRIDALEYPFEPASKKAFYVPDHDVERLSVRVYPNNTKRFVIRYYESQTKRERVIGRYGDITLEQARTLARQALLNIDTGRPFNADALVPIPKSESAPLSPTFADFTERYLAEHIDLLRSSYEMRRLIIGKLVPRFGAMHLHEIDRAACQRMKTEMKDTPYEANRTMEVLRAMLNKAVDWEVLPDNFVNPLKRVQPFREERRDRLVTHEEFRLLLEAIDQIDSIHTRVLLRTLIDVPLRKGELMRARWTEFDTDPPMLRVANTSHNKRTAPQPLTTELAEAIAALPRIEGNPFIFPSRDGKTHIKDIDSQWKRVKKLAGVTDIRLHDLRRTIATDYARSGASAYEILRMLSHSNPTTALHYVHLAGNEGQRTFAEERAARRGG